MSDDTTTGQPEQCGCLGWDQPHRKGVGGCINEAPERTFFERDAERRIVEYTTALLNDLDRLALRYDVDKQTVEAACQRFSGPDLADCWTEHVGEAEL